MRSIRPYLVLLVLCVVLPTPRFSFACSCGDAPITERFEDAKTLLLVKAGPTTSETDEEGREIRKWPFEIVELYKGEPRFKLLWSSGGGASCGAHLRQNQHYLVSTGDDGRVGLCSTSRIGSDPMNNDEIIVLNAHKYGEISELTEPWSFSESAETCSVTHQFTSGGSYLQFFYRFKKPEHLDARQYQFPIPYRAPGGRENRRPIEDRGPHPSSEPGFLNLRIRFGSGRHVEEGSARLIIDDRQWRTRRTLMEAPWAYPYEVIDEEETREVLGALANASSVSATWRLWQLRDYQQKRYPEYPEAFARTSVLFLGDAISNFMQCVERGVVHDN
ncbi:MAG: hypothetical protein QNJ19_02795 [Woeseiaceae bacterium]|nr:hypothetical protein [Woeseiaceae bacterium]